ncbi:MAG: hypothetical protein ACUVR0_11325 [Candidatus Aminicenantales bacterium]
MSGTSSLGLLMSRTPLATEKESAKEAGQVGASSRPKTNIDEALKVPKTRYSLPGLFPARVVEIHDPKAMDSESGKASAEVIKSMFEKGLTSLTSQDLNKSISLFFTRDDVVGIKVTRRGPISSAPAWK